MGKEADVQRLRAGNCESQFPVLLIIERTARGLHEGLQWLLSHPAPPQRDTDTADSEDPFSFLWKSSTGDINCEGTASKGK